MPKPLSNDLRCRLVECVEAGSSRREAAALFRTATSSAVNVLKLWKETGSVEPRPRGGYRHGKLKQHCEFILAIVERQHDITMPELAKARAEWKDTRQPLMGALRHRLIFIDETGTTTKMTRLRGRSAKGERLNSRAPFGHWGTQTFVAGLRCDGLTAPWVIDAPMNRDIFETCVETQLAPVLRPGDAVILDNLSSHKSERASKAIQARGAWMLFLPPYSPDLNPIEMAFSKL